MKADVYRVGFIHYENDRSTQLTWPGLKAIMLVTNETKNTRRAKQFYEWPSADEMSLIWDEMCR
jgi:hypothetical protein